jgi:hypothetical protein
VCVRTHTHIHPYVHTCRNPITRTHLAGSAKEQAKQATSASEVAKSALEEIAKARERIAQQSATIEDAHKQAQLSADDTKVAQKEEAGMKCTT